MQISFQSQDLEFDYNFLLFGEIVHFFKLDKVYISNFYVVLSDS